MNLEMENNRQRFYQWDTGQKLIVKDADGCDYVHFANAGLEQALVCQIRELDGIRVVDVPNILLQNHEPFYAYLYGCAEDGARTEYVNYFEVCKRPRPENYVYTETEVLNYANLMDRLEQAENTCLSVEERLSLTASGSPALPNGTDLDTLMAGGNHRISSAAAAETMVNTPTAKAGGKLIVMEGVGSNRIYQIYMSNVKDMILYIRYFNGSWQPWKRFAYAEDVESAIADAINEIAMEDKGAVRFDSPQELTEDRKAQARANIGTISADVGQITFEEGKYVNVISKQIQSQDYFALSNPISVLPSAKMNVTSYCDSIVGVGLFSGETIIGAVSITEETTHGLHTREIEIPENCDNIRISVVKSQMDRVSCEFTEIAKSVVDTCYKKVSRSEVEVLTKPIAVKKRTGLNSSDCWTNLSMQNTGLLIPSTTRVMTLGLHRDIDSVSCADGYNCRVVCYDAAKAYMGQWTGISIQKYDTNHAAVDFSKIYENTSAKYFKLILLKTDGSNITAEEHTAITVVFRTSELEEKIMKDVENTSSVFSKRVSEDLSFDREIIFKSCFRASYQFPKDIHSAAGEYELFRMQCGMTSVSVKFAKAVTTSPTGVPLCPVPVYNAGFKVYLNDNLRDTLIPDGWRRELLLGDDPMSVRFTGDCSIAANQDIRLKVDADNILFYHSSSNTAIASFAKSAYATMRDLYGALNTATVSALSDFEVFPMNLENLTPNDIIECDVPLVGQYYDNESESGTHFDAFPFYFTTKQQSGKVYDVEILFNKDAEYPIQILVNGYCVTKYHRSENVVENIFALPVTFLVKDQSEVGIVTESMEYNAVSDLSKYPDIKVLYAERVDEGLDSLNPGYSVSQNKVIGWASYLRKKGRKYICMKDIERLLDSAMKTSDNFLWTFQLDDGSIECVTNADVRNSLLRNNIRPAIAMMLNKAVSETDLKAVKASEHAGFEYHIHSCYTDGNTSMAYYSYPQLDANITEAIEKFIDTFGSVPTVLGKHGGKAHYSLCRYLKNKGFRVIFADNGEGASLNEITRFACKRNVILETLLYTDIKNLDRTY